MNGSIFLRMLIAVLFCVVMYMILPPTFRLIGFPMSGDLETVIRVCIAACAVFYIFTGRPAIS